MNSRRVPLLIFLALIFGLGCQNANLVPVPETPALQPALQPAAPLAAEKSTVGYTYVRPDGNRLIEGRGSMPNVQPVDISLDGEPRWVVAVPMDGGSLWAVTLEDGRIQYFQVSGRQATEVVRSPDHIPPGKPPALYVDASGKVILVTSDDEDASLVSHLVVIQYGEGRAYVDTEGNLVVRNSRGETRLPINALPDARILTDENDRLLLLTDATKRYRHGVLGDATTT